MSTPYEQPRRAGRESLLTLDPTRPIREQIIHPYQLVNQYGAKEGYLRYVRNQLPDIPQARSLVALPQESAAAFSDRMQKLFGTGLVMLRSSSPEELEVGTEGLFTSNPMRLDLPKESIVQQIELIRGSSIFKADYVRRLSPNPLFIPEKKPIPVIAAQYLPSRYIGTMIADPRHPQRSFFSLAQNTREYYNAQEELSHTYVHENGLIRRLAQFHRRNRIHPDPAVLNQLARIAQWDSRISQLPDIDSRMLYQLEFAVDPKIGSHLLQIRPLLPKHPGRSAGAALPQTTDTLTFGGIDQPLSTTAYTDYKDPAGKAASLCYWGPLHDTRYLQSKNSMNIAVIFQPYGVFQHQDIRQIRRTQLTIYTTKPLPPIPHGTPLTIMPRGDSYAIFSGSQQLL